MLQHTSKCLYQISKELGVPTNCLCDDCKGVNSHSQPPVVTPPPSTPKPALPPTSIPAVPKIIERNADQLRGVTCFYCDEKKEKKVPQGQDEMMIGAHRKIKLCMKSELREPLKRHAIEKAIDAEFEIVAGKDDPPPTTKGSFTDSQPQDEESAQEEELVGCSGYLDEACEKQCRIGNNEQLYGTDGDDRFKPILAYTQYTPRETLTFYFCKGSHMMRFVNKLHKPNKGKGKAKHKTTPTTTSNTQPTNTDLPLQTTTPSARGRGSRGGQGLRGRGCGRGRGSAESGDSSPVSN